MAKKDDIKKAICHFECMRDDAQVVLDTGFGTHPGENDLVYRNRKMYAGLAIEALGKMLEAENPEVSDHPDVQITPVLDEFSIQLKEYTDFYGKEAMRQLENRRNKVVNWVTTNYPNTAKVKAKIRSPRSIQKDMTAFELETMSGAVIADVCDDIVSIRVTFKDMDTMDAFIEVVRDQWEVVRSYFIPGKQKHTFIIETGLGMAKLKIRVRPEKEDLINKCD